MNTVQEITKKEWINWSRPSSEDADEFFQVEIRLSNADPGREKTTFAFWGNVGLGTPWRRTWRWHSNMQLVKQLRGEIHERDEAPTEPLVRTFASVTRTYNPVCGSWCIDAVADDGTAWYRLPGSDKWLPHPALPQPDQTED